MTPHLDILTEETKRTLTLLPELSLMTRFYLAGGTGAALHLGHRISADLDFFSQREFNESLLIQSLSDLGTFHLEKRAEQSVTGILNNTKLSFFTYTYPLLAPLSTITGIQVADIIDIACMKIDTISSRGARRDFIDVYYIMRERISLQDLLNLFGKKYVSIHYNIMHIKKSLVYFEDAEQEPMPRMIKKIDWEDVKAFFQEEVVKLL